MYYECEKKATRQYNVDFAVAWVKVTSGFVTFSSHGLKLSHRRR